MTSVHSRVELDRSYGKLPLRFEPTFGDAGSEVRFTSRGRGFGLVIGPHDVVIDLQEATLRIVLVDAAATALAAGEDLLPGKSHYFIGNDPKSWRTNVPHFSRVKVKEVYPGIDVLYYDKDDHLEYDFIVGAGCDPAAIRFRIEGVKGTKLRKDGHLVLETPKGEFLLQRPSIYQEQSGLRTKVEGGYWLDPQDPRTVGFRVGEYDKTVPLIVDPVLVYSTFLGGNNGESGKGLGTDSAGNLYVGGQTSSVNFPKVSPLQPFLGGGADAFVAKFNPEGTALLYCTYLGGSGSFDQAYSLRVDAEGNAYATGETNSSNFPLVNPIQSTYGGATDAFVAKINPSGSALMFSTYLGGSALDKTFDIAVDSARHVSVAGYTASTNFPTRNPVQPTFGGGLRDAFVAKLSADGLGLVFSTYLGGLDIDESRGVATDDGGNVYVTGDTRSTNFPTLNPIQASYGGGSSDAFITKINPDGSAFVYSTYLGGSLDEDSFGVRLIAVDGSTSVYITGNTSSSNFPIKNPIQPTRHGLSDAFVAKINTAGSALVYATFLGGSDDYDDGYSIAVDAFGNAYVTGQTESPVDFPTINAVQPTYGGGNGDAFLTMINAEGSAFVYSTYLGGTNEDRANAIALDAENNVYLTGQTFSANFPTVNPIQATYAGTADAFVAKISGLLPPSGVTSVAWTDGMTLSWAAVPDSETYHLFRGTGSDLPKLLDAGIDSCLRLSTAEVSSGPALTENPSTGDLLWYLVRAANVVGMGPGGQASSGPRLVDSSGDCP